MENEVQVLTDAIRRLDRGLLLVVTGAGVSAASGLSTFRGIDPDAIWNRDVTEIGTFAFFRRDPVAWWRWFLATFAGLWEVAPNPAHQALADLERWQAGRPGEFLLVTQNTDTLHEQAGARRMIKVHGSGDRVRCTSPDCRNAAPSGSLPADRAAFAAFLERPGPATLPRCPVCSALLRPHALLFDEFYQEHHDYGWSEIERAAGRMGLLLFAGTSFSVGVTERLLREAVGWRIPTFSIDPAPTGRTPGVTLLPARAEEILPEVCRRLGAVNIP